VGRCPANSGGALKWLRLRVASEPSGKPVFWGWTRRAAEKLRLDLGAVGIPYETARIDSRDLGTLDKRSAIADPTKIC
jgi:hypothetical protein